MARSTLLAIGLIVVAGAAIGASQLLPFTTSQAHSSEVPKLVGSETAAVGCEFDGGYNVCNYGPANLKDTWLRWKELIGEPLSGFDSHCQIFRFATLCYDQGAPQGWEVQLLNSGLDQLHAEGRLSESNPQIHPAVRDWLISEMELGVDTVRLIGKPESSVLCDKTTAMCRQYFSKTAFIVPAGADVVSGQAVQRLPLGLWKVQASGSTSKAAESGSSPLSGPMAITVVVILTGIGLALLALSFRRGGPGRGMTI